MDDRSIVALYLRRGALLALQWTDLDGERKTLSITKQVSRP